MITFDPVRHQYKNDFTGEQYISVTTLLGKYKKPFDSATAAERVAKRDGKTVEDVLAGWKKINTDSQVYGTRIHKILETYNTSGEYKGQDEELVKAYDRLGLINIHRDDLLNEELLCLHEAKLAGTADIIRLEDKGCFSVFDIKTNKKFNLFSQYGERYLKPLDHLPVCELTTYSLQLSLYAYMFQCLTGRNLNQLGIIYYNRENNTFQHYPVAYMKSDVKLLLEHYAKG